MTIYVIQEKVGGEWIVTGPVMAYLYKEDAEEATKYLGSECKVVEYEPKKETI